LELLVRKKKKKRKRKEFHWKTEQQEIDCWRDAVDNFSKFPVCSNNFLSRRRKRTEMRFSLFILGASKQWDSKKIRRQWELWW
jgi:hypothetical protein